ncbi:MAG: hypothetical protein JST80_06605 [Bdellovibrionales bacterium]|nr:hypothetical protein [Bdellovibrionales bacterium]
MKTVIPFLLAVVCILNFNQTANAQSSANQQRLAAQAALDARNEFVSALQKKDFTALAHAGFDHAVREAAEKLRETDVAAADELIQKWESDEGSLNFENAMMMLQFNDLGDHAPLFAWLETYINKLGDKFGALILNLPIIKTVRTLNFAIPVVFRPNGEWQVAGVDNRIEYRKHFIPFANIITYYVSLYACKAIIIKQGWPSQLNQLCSKAADKLEFVMGRYIAAPISDFIYKAAHRSRAHAPVFGRSQLQYETGEDLANDIRRGGLTLQ